MIEDNYILDYIKNKNILITGGTGSFGNEILDQLLQYNPFSITILSRDENKQYNMQKKYEQYNNYLKIEFKIGDVRDYQRVKEATKGKDLVFHAAALKQVPNCEISPYEAVLTNILGAENVRKACIDSNVETVVFISTDKAVKPINVMGMTKGLQERIFLNTAGKEDTKFIGVRYGNVLGSRGSVLHSFYNNIKDNIPIKLTNPQMTRFQFTLNEAVGLVFYAAIHGEKGDLIVKKMNGANMIDFAKAFSSGITNNENYPIDIVGIRPGEKMHEILVSEEEMYRSSEEKDHFIIHNWEKLNKTNIPLKDFEFGSNNTYQMSIPEIKEMLIEDKWIKKEGGRGDKLNGQ